MPIAVAELSSPEDGTRLVAPVSTKAVDLGAHGYVEHEWFVGGTATSFATSRWPADGRLEVVADRRAGYRTRIVVRRPAEAAHSSGVVVVEWCNVSGGIEAAADWSYLHPEILRAGHSYVAVTAQALGVQGGDGLVDAPRIRPGGLVGASPERYATLRHPGDAFAFDIYRQVGAALRGPDGEVVLGGVRPRWVIAMGESQSAFFLTTYIDALAPDGLGYDGVLVHSRGGRGASLGGGVYEDEVPRGLRIRADVPVPVMQLQTETDLGPRLAFAPARQPDGERLRTWEVAGTAHADAYLVGPHMSAFGWKQPVNDGPHHWVVQAALAHLVRWVQGGDPPPSALPLELAAEDPPVLARDEVGIARGGVRTPDVDVPVAVLSGDAPEGADVLRSLFGTTTAFDGPALVQRYGTRARYLAAYEACLDETIAAGFLLGADREELLQRAARVVFPS